MITVEVITMINRCLLQATLALSLLVGGLDFSPVAAAGAPPAAANFADNDHHRISHKEKLMYVLVLVAVIFFAETASNYFKRQISYSAHTECNPVIYGGSVDNREAFCLQTFPHCLSRGAYGDCGECLADPSERYDQYLASEFYGGLRETSPTPPCTDHGLVCNPALDIRERLFNNFDGPTSDDGDFDMAEKLDHRLPRFLEKLTRIASQQLTSFPCLARVATTLLHTEIAAMEHRCRAELPGCGEPGDTYGLCGEMGTAKERSALHQLTILDPRRNHWPYHQTAEALSDGRYPCMASAWTVYDSLPAIRQLRNSGHLSLGGNYTTMDSLSETYNIARNNLQSLRRSLEFAQKLLAIFHRLRPLRRSIDWNRGLQLLNKLEGHLSNTRDIVSTIRSYHTERLQRGYNDWHSLSREIELLNELAGLTANYTRAMTNNRRVLLRHNTPSATSLLDRIAWYFAARTEIDEILE